MAATFAPFMFFAAAPAPPLDRFLEMIWAVRSVGSCGRAAVPPNGAGVACRGAA